MSYDSPPYWFYDSGSGYGLLSGRTSVGFPSIGSEYQSATQQVPGSGVPVYGFGAMATWDPHVYAAPPYFIGTMNFTTNPCDGATEYGFAHYPYYNPPVNQFYFYENSNCAESATNQPGSYACYTTPSKTQLAEQCQGAVNLPTLTTNSDGNYWYFWYIYVSFNSSNDHYFLNAGLEDPYNQASKWSCTYDVTANTFSNCPNSGSVAYSCPAGEPFYAYPASTLYPNHGAVTVGVENSSNVPPTGGVNPMMQMTALYVLETAP